MVDLCQRFLQREIDLRELVNGLEGLLDAGEFRDQSLRKRWYSMWTPLEIRNATGEIDWSPEAAREVSALKTFLCETYTANGCL